MSILRPWLAGCASVLLVVASAGAVNMETVPVGDPGNAGELSGAGVGDYGNHGPDGICGSVNYTYNIGKYEVTAGQYTEFLNKVAAKTDPYGLYNPKMWSSVSACKIERSGTSGSYTYSVVADAANRPVNYVSYWDACRFANWLNNGQPTGAPGPTTTERGTYTLDGYNLFDGRTIQRNPGSTWAVTSEDEWYKAAYYKGGSTDAGYFDYPTSSDTAPGGDMADASGNNANWVFGGTTYPVDPPFFTTMVGEFQNSHSPYGTFDQGANVWEWNEAIENQTPTSVSRGLRGGCFLSAGMNASYRLFQSPMTEMEVIGFRVAEVPEPTSMVLLTIGGLAIVRKRLRRHHKG